MMTVRNTSATTIFHSAERPVILVMTTERPSMPTTVTAVQARKTGHPDNSTNQSVQLTGWPLTKVCAAAQKRVKRKVALLD